MKIRKGAKADAHFLCRGKVTLVKKRLEYGSVRNWQIMSEMI